MQGKTTQAKYFYQNYGGTNGSKWVNCIAMYGVPANVTNRPVPTPSYTYTALSANDAVTAVTNATCGAGATLQVTTAGVVSSSCGNNENQNENQGESSCISLLAAPSLPTGMTLTVNGSTPAYDATNGITLATNSDYLCVDVSGMNTTILSAVVTVKTGSTADTKGFYYGNECAESFASNNSIVNTGTDWADYSLNALNSSVLSIRRRGTSTNIKRICLTLADELPTGEPLSTTLSPKGERAIRLIDGEIVIERNGVRYDITGRKLK